MHLGIFSSIVRLLTLRQPLSYPDITYSNTNHNA
jgi:hypothetical protein